MCRCFHARGYTYYGFWSHSPLSFYNIKKNIMSVTQIEFRKKIFEVEYDYAPEEKQVTYYPDGSGYPGCAEQVDICKVTHNGEDFTDFIFESERDCEEIEEMILKELHLINEI